MEDRDNPALNQSGDPRDPRPAHVEGTPTVASTQGTTEFRMGDITIAPGGDVDNVILRHANVGTEKKVAVTAIASVLEDRFFTDKTDAAPERG